MGGKGLTDSEMDDDHKSSSCLPSKPRAGQEVVRDSKTTEALDLRKLRRMVTWHLGDLDAARV